MSKTELLSPAAGPLALWKTHNYNAPTYPVGRVTCKREHTLRNASFETASWYEDITVPVGATATLWYNGGFYAARCTMHGVISASHFPSSFGGMSYGANPSDAAKIGKPGSIGVGIGTSTIEAGGDDDWIVTLAPEYSVKDGAWYIAPGGHPLDMVREWREDERDGSYYGRHAYRMFWRGEDRGRVWVDGSKGFNGDTSGAAMRQAVEILKSE